MSPQLEEINYSLLPAHMQQGAKYYINEGIPPGSFLYRLLTNAPFTDVVMAADEINVRHLREWTAWLYYEVPSYLWGSQEKVDRHIAACQRERERD